MSKPKKTPKKNPPVQPSLTFDVLLDYESEQLEQLVDSLFTGPCPLTEAGFHVE